MDHLKMLLNFIMKITTIKGGQMRSTKGLAGKRTRYIKQVTDSKGRIKKSSRVIIVPLNYEDTICKCRKNDDIKMLMVSNIRRIYQKHLAIRNIIIVILIALLIMWR